MYVFYFRQLESGSPAVKYKPPGEIGWLLKISKNRKTKHRRICSKSEANKKRDEVTEMSIVLTARYWKSIGSVERSMVTFGLTYRSRIRASSTRRLLRLVINRFHSTCNHRTASSGGQSASRSGSSCSNSNVTAISGATGLARIFANPGSNKYNVPARLSGNERTIEWAQLRRTTGHSSNTAESKKLMSLKKELPRTRKNECNGKDVDHNKNEIIQTSKLQPWRRHINNIYLISWLTKDFLFGIVQCFGVVCYNKGHTESE